MIQRDDPHLTLDEALSGQIPRGIRGMVLGSNGSSRPVKVQELPDGGFDEVHDISVVRELPCGGEPVVHKLFWVRRHGSPAMFMDRLRRLKPGELLEPREQTGGGGGGASGSKAKLKKGSGHPSPHPGYKMPENFNKGFGFGQQKLDGVDIIGGGCDPIERRNNKLALLRRQVVLQRQATARHKKEAEKARYNEEDALRAKQREAAATYQADRLEAKIYIIVSGKRRKTSAKTAKTNSDRKNAKKEKKKRQKGNQQGKKSEE